MDGLVQASLSLPYGRPIGVGREGVPHLAFPCGILAWNPAVFWGGRAEAFGSLQPQAANYMRGMGLRCRFFGKATSMLPGIVR